MQQIPQPQMVPQNVQNQLNNPQPMPPQGQVYQIVQHNSTISRCEKFSTWISGVGNIPLAVFLVLMGSSANFILCLICPFARSYTIVSSLANFLFTLFVWSKMAIKIEKKTSTVRYGYLYFLNNAILSVCTLRLPLCLCRIWCFVLFETLLILLNNRDKKVKFFCCSLSGNKVIIFTIIYHFLFNSFAPLALTIGYVFLYKKYLLKKFSISNEKVERIENWCLVGWTKNKLQTFITMNEVLNKSQQSLVQNSNASNVSNSNGSSFVPVNMYPVYYSNVQAMQPPMQVIPPVQPIGQAQSIREIDSNSSMVNLNQPSQ
jgi:hypothetical protein